MKIEDIGDDMVREMLLRQEYINQRACTELVDGGGVGKEIASEVRSRIDGVVWEYPNQRANEAFVSAVIKMRPRSNEILVELGVLSFLEGVISRMKLQD